MSVGMDNKRKSFSMFYILVQFVEKDCINIRYNDKLNTIGMSTKFYLQLDHVIYLKDIQ